MIAKGLINLKQENLRFPEKSCLIKQTQFYWGFHGLGEKEIRKSYFVPLTFLPDGVYYGKKILSQKGGLLWP